MADSFKVEIDMETVKVESEVESSVGESDYCPSNDGSYSEASPRSPSHRRGRKRTAEDAKSRTLMRQWLLDLIDSGRIPGLHWIDDNKTLVHIPWLHASRHTFDTDKDSTLFREWAIHSGKFMPGEDAPDPKRWKANFRCAINSLSDVREVKTQSCKKGHDAFKVYRFDVDKRLAKRLSCSANERTMSNDVLPPSEKKACKRAVLNADRRALLMNARKMNRANHVSGPAMPMTPLNKSASLTTPITRANEPAYQMTRPNESTTPPSAANEPAIHSTRASELSIPMPRACGAAAATTIRAFEPAFPTTQASAPPNVIINWLKQQRDSHHNEMCNDVSYDEFGGGMSARDQVSPDVKYEGPGFYRPTEAVGCRDNGYAYGSGVVTDNTNNAGIPQMTGGYLSRSAIQQHTTYESALSQYSLDVCDSPTDSNGSNDSALTDDSIAEMIDEWQAESPPKLETSGKWFMQLTSVNISITPENSYLYHDMPAQACATH